MPHFCHARRHLRRGGIAFEMILVLVVLLVVTIGVVQFGIFLSNAQQVALAARVGGLEASQTMNLPITDGPVPSDIISAIEHQLESSCIDWCSIRVEHNVRPDGNPVELLSQADPNCVCETDDFLDAPPNRPYVRVTVCVPISEVMPQQLSFFGRQIYGTDDTYEHTTVFRYELETP